MLKGSREDLCGKGFREEVSERVKELQWDWGEPGNTDKAVNA